MPSEKYPGHQMGRCGSFCTSTAPRPDSFEGCLFLVSKEIGRIHGQNEVEYCETLWSIQLWGPKLTTFSFFGDDKRNFMPDKWNKSCATVVEMIIHPVSKKRSFLSLRGQWHTTRCFPLEKWFALNTRWWESKIRHGQHNMGLGET